MTEEKEARWIEKVAALRGTTPSKYVAHILREHHRRMKTEAELKEEKRVRLQRQLLAARDKADKIEKDLKGVK